MRCELGECVHSDVDLGMSEIMQAPRWIPPVSMRYEGVTRPGYSPDRARLLGEKAMCFNKLGEV